VLRFTLTDFGSVTAAMNSVSHRKLSIRQERASAQPCITKEVSKVTEWMTGTLSLCYQ
jgi:hypothetical protein